MFGEDIIDPGCPTGQSDAREDIVTSRPRWFPIHRTQRVVAVKIPGWLQFRDRVSSRGKQIEQVAAVGSGGGHPGDEVACLIGPGQGNAHTTQREFARVSHPVTVTIEEDFACKAAENFAKVHAAQSGGRHRDIYHCRRTDRAVAEAGWLRLNDLIIAERNVCELVAAVWSGADHIRLEASLVRIIDRIAIGIEQGHRDTRQSWFSCILGAVAVVVAEHSASNDDTPFAEDIIGSGRTSGDGDARQHIVAIRSAEGTGCVEAVVIPFRLVDFREGVCTRDDRRETVVAIRISDR